MPQKFVSYCRVSSQKQGASGLGLEAQQETVKRFLNGGSWELIAEFVEVETGKGADALAKRPKLKAALDACRKHGATLVIAKLDRLARNVYFVSGLMESKVRFVACDMPEANELTIHIMAAFAEHEAKRISQRTKDALAVVKSRGVLLGTCGPANLKRCLEERTAAANAGALKLAGLFAGFDARKLSQRAVVAELNAVGVPAPRGGVWSLAQVQRMLKRLAAMTLAPNSNAGAW
jgi:DNA invertase Pin-like site-specific DNA recombinase